MGLSFKKWLAGKLTGGEEKKKLIEVDWPEFWGCWTMCISVSSPSGPV